MKTSLITVKMFTWTIVFTSAPEDQWFGENNKYKCRCPQCPGCATGCNKGWFGPMCQYVDLAVRSHVSMRELIDNNENTCVHNKSASSVTFNWRSFRFQFTWMRIFASNSSKFNNIKIQFRRTENSHTTVTPCFNFTKTKPTKYAMDVNCMMNATVSLMELSGSGIPNLCSVYVSGGRNVALKGEVEQSTTLVGYEASANNAVDGNTDGNFTHGSCSHTQREPYPSLYLTFDKPKMVTRIVLFNRLGKVAERLKGFLISAFSNFNSSIPTYAYNDPFEKAQSQYEISEMLLPEPTNRIQVSFSDEGPQGKFLTICELEVYGDSVCDSEFWGIDCNNSCNCNGAPCYPNNGQCHSGCPKGFQGEGCNSECDPGFFGNCIESCSFKCDDSLCNSTTGFCFGCKKGYKGDFCETCPSGKYGPDCAYSCAKFCKGHICDPLNGSCYECVAGHRGNFCEQKCYKGTYGQDCIKKCSGHCLNGTCNSLTGNCDYGCLPGYIGKKCMDHCHNLHYGVNCGFDCSDHCQEALKKDARLCDRTSGKCLFGCVEGYRGLRCQNKLRHEGTNVLNGLFIAFGVLLAFMITVCLLLRQRSDRNSLDSDPDDVSTLSKTTAEANTSKKQSLWT